MKSFTQTLVRIVGFACLWLAASSAEAVSPRAYVSVSGSDLNTCNVPTTPCRTFTGAIAQVTSGGEVIVMDSGTFGGGTITQAVTINAPSGVAALAATPIIINAGTSDVVTLRGISFVAPSPGVGTALTYTTGGVLNVENCIFHGWFGAITFQSAGKLNVVDTTLRDLVIGVYLQTASGAIQAEFVRVRVLDNSNAGIFVNSRTTAVVKDSVISRNSTGLYASVSAGGTAELTVENCLVSHNFNWGVYSSSGGTIRVAASTVTNNATGFFQGAGTFLSRGNNIVEGNGTDTSGTIGSFAGK